MRLLHVIWIALVSAHLAHLAPADDELTSEFLCIHQDCYSVSWSSKRYTRASTACRDIQGHLMTVTNSVQADAITLLTGRVRKADARVWIGLQRSPSDRCAEGRRPLRGFTWVTGESDTNYENWNSGEKKCGACVTVYRNGTWEETECDYRADGYLCQLRHSALCNTLTLPTGDSATYYHTSLGRINDEGLVVPPGTIAVVSTLQDPLFCQEKGSGNMAWSSKTPGAWTCLIENGGCEQECLEISGTPQCKCPPGSPLKADNRTCSQPCDPSPCSQMCVPIEDPPGFICMCSEGYYLTADGKTCEDVDDCTANPNICEHHCTNTIGSFTCSCKPGFEMVDVCDDPNECVTECQDINECNSPATLCEHECENHLGGFRCVCEQGYVIDEKNPNKCKRFCNTSSCEAECDVNKRDSCQCPDGYIVDEDEAGDPICTDVDECDASPCDGSCINLFGSYQCTCSEGFTVHNTACIPPEEGSGGTETPPDTTSGIPPSTSTPPDIYSLQPSMLLGICIGIISMLTVLIAILCHMLRKHYMEQHDMEYKCKNTEKDVDLQQVKTDPQKKL